MSPIIWAALAMLLGLLLLMLEFFIPSAGVLGFLAFVALLVSLVMAFSADLYWGVGFLGAMVVALPGVIMLALHWFPYTPVGRRILLQPPGDVGDEPEPTTSSLTELIGRIGKAGTMMLPSGAVEIDGRNYDAVSRGMPIESGQYVRVVEAHSNRIVVVPVSDRDVRDEPTQRKRKVSQDPLDQPIESLGVDPFENPFS
jgi:membrane-bound ClpP family serine protease